MLSIVGRFLAFEIDEGATALHAVYLSVSIDANSTWIFSSTSTRDREWLYLSTADR
jgi:hypothetical protein